ncbi:MAG: DUF2178 domain-containing protein [Candidatus Pacearchaeota archaeon]
MEYRKFMIYRVLIVVILAMIVSTFVSIGNYIIPLVVFILAIITMFTLKKKIIEKLTDERIDKIAGKASRITMTVSVLAMVLIGIVLIALRESYPEYLIVGNVLAYFACGILIFYSILFKIFLKMKI